MAWPSVDGQVIHLSNGKVKVKLATSFHGKTFKSSAVAVSEAAAKRKARQQLSTKIARQERREIRAALKRRGDI